MQNSIVGDADDTGGEQGDSHAQVIARALLLVLFARSTNRQQQGDGSAAQRTRTTKKRVTRAMN